jgi:hypothetical protein
VGRRGSAGTDRKRRERFAPLDPPRPLIRNRLERAGQLIRIDAEKLCRIDGIDQRIGVAEVSWTLPRLEVEVSGMPQVRRRYPPKFRPQIRGAGPIRTDASGPRASSIRRRNRSGAGSGRLSVRAGLARTAA